jgi:hypothetical protein
MNSEIRRTAPLAAAIAVVLLAIVGGVPLFKGDRKAPAARVASDVAVNVSLIQLIAGPEKFDDRRIVVSGFLVNESGEHALYIGANDAINGLDNKITVNLRASTVPQDVQDQLNREYVALRGVFKGGSQPEISGIDYLVETHGAVKRPPLGE